MSQPPSGARRRIARLLGVDNAVPEVESRLVRDADAPQGISPEDAEIIRTVSPFTMTSPERVLATVDAVRYCVRRGIQGSFAECGVWLGGSVLAMIMALQELDVDDRDIYLFDTFEGMTAPTEHDVSSLDPPALQTWTEANAKNERAWPEMFSSKVFNEETVRETVLSTGYPPERVHLIRGPVEMTLPDNAPQSLALMRLDTDWYESTLHELRHLYPVLADAGVLIIDDYGHWDGARRAVDEYFGSSAPPILLNRIDYTGRIGTKG